MCFLPRREPTAESMVGEIRSPPSVFHSVSIRVCHADSWTMDCLWDPAAAGLHCESYGKVLDEWFVGHPTHCSVRDVVLCEGPLAQFHHPQYWHEDADLRYLRSTPQVEHRGIIVSLKIPNPPKHYGMNEIRHLRRGPTRTYIHTATELTRLGVVFTRAGRYLEMAKALIWQYLRARVEASCV